MPLPTILSGNVASALGGGYEVDNSCRFNRADSPYMHITPGGDGNLKIFTVSFWVKRVSVNGGTSGTDREVIFSNATNDQFSFHNDKFEFLEDGSTSASTKMLFRDFAAWYHIVAAFDTNQATNTNRCKIYVNGVQVDQSTGFSTMSYVAEDLEMGFGKGSEMMSVGRSEYDDNRHFNGYLSEFYYINGTMLTPSSFGEFDEDSPTIWKPKEFTGSYGTNGFYLDFKASANLGNDANGGTDLTEVNLAAADQMLDTPTNNFPTFNVLAKTNPALAYSGYILDKGSIRFRGNTEGTSTTTPTLSMTGGKWYTEFYIEDDPAGAWPVIGVVITSYISALQNISNYQHSSIAAATSHVDTQNGLIKKFGASSTVTGGTACVDGDVIGIAVDIDAGKWWFAKNNTWSDSGDPAAGSNALDTFTAGTELSHWVASYNGASYTYINAGQDSTFDGEISAGGNADGNGYGDFKYTPPSGFLALCTKNLGSDGG